MPRPLNSNLSDQEYDRTRAALIDLTFRGATPSKSPIAILVGGAPGAGKTTAIAAIRPVLASEGGGVLIDIDQWSGFHPRFRDFLKLDPESADFRINQDICALREDVIRYALDVVHCNLLIETWMVLPRPIAEALGYELPEQFVQRMNHFKESGYKRHLVGIAESNETSWQGTLLRDELLRTARGRGRRVPRDFHDAVYDVMPETLQLVEAEKLADFVTLYRRGEIEIYHNELDENGQWVKKPEGRDRLLRDRTRPRSFQELAEFVENYKKLVEMRATRQATPEELAEVQTLLTEAVPKLRVREIQPAEGLAVEGTIVGVTSDSVYQERKLLGGGSQFIRHNRHLFESENVPALGANVRVEYQNGRARIDPRTRKKGISR